MCVGIIKVYCSAKLYVAKNLLYVANRATVYSAAVVQVGVAVEAAIRSQRLAATSCVSVIRACRKLSSNRCVPDTLSLNSL